jgi:hypothetical protein
MTRTRFLKGIFYMLHILLLGALQLPKKHWKEQSQQTARASVKARCQKGSSSLRCERNIENDSQGPTVRVRPSMGTLESYAFNFDELALLPLRKKFGPNADWPIRNLLHRLDIRVPLKFIAEINQVIEHFFRWSVNLNTILNDCHVKSP